jgi:hypothetical protein
VHHRLPRVSSLHPVPSRSSTAASTSKYTLKIKTKTKTKTLGPSLHTYKNLLVPNQEQKTNSSSDNVHRNDWQLACWGLEHRGIVSLEKCHCHHQNPQAQRSSKHGGSGRGDERLEDETLRGSTWVRAEVTRDWRMKPCKEALWMSFSG